MTTKAEIDVIRRIFAPLSEGNYIELGPWPDSPQDTLELRTVGKKNIEYFGELRLSMNVAFAEAIGKALLAAVKELRDGDMHD